MRPYGYTNGGAVIDSEAEIIREVADRVVRGESMVSIIRNITDRGVRTSYGYVFRTGDFVEILRSGRISGSAGVGKMAGNCAAIISPQLHDQVRNVLAQPYVVRRATNNHRCNPATGWLRCGRCGVAMRPKDGFYICVKRQPYGGCGRMKIGADASDKVVLEAVIAHVLEEPKRWEKWFQVEPGNLTADVVGHWFNDVADVHRQQDLLAALIDYVSVLPVPRAGYAPTSTAERLDFVWRI